MAEHGQLLRLDIGRPRAPDEPGLAELLDPVALEARLKEARARRSAALAGRDAGEATPEPVPPASHVARPRALVPWLVFAIGLAVGGSLTAFAVQPDLRRGLALLIAPEIAPPPTAADASGPAPEAAATPPAAPPSVTRPAPQAASAPLAIDPARALGDGPSAPPPDAAPGMPKAAAAGAARAQVAAATPALPAAALPAAPAAPAAALPPAAAQPAPPSVPAAEGRLPEPTPAALATPALPPRVVIHFPASAEAEALEVRAALLAAGAANVQVVPVRFPIAASNVRYYHAADRDGAGRVAALAAPTLPAAPDTRDFTDFRPPPLAGRVELWLAGSPSPAAPRPAAPRASAAPPAPPPAAPPPFAVGTPQDQAEAVARIIVQRSLERLLTEPPAP